MMQHRHSHNCKQRKSMTKPEATQIRHTQTELHKQTDIVRQRGARTRAVAIHCAYLGVMPTIDQGKRKQQRSV